MELELKVLDQEFAICKLADLTQIDHDAEFYFIGKTDEEVSLVCAIDAVPGNALNCDCGWKGFRIEGVLDFSLIGILSRIADLLASAKIGIFAISTYNTDYVLTKKESFSRAIDTLAQNGYIIVD